MKWDGIKHDEEIYHIWKGNLLVRFSNFISGLFFFSESGVLAEDIPETFYPFALPSTIIGIILLLISNFFKKRNV